MKPLKLIGSFLIVILAISSLDGQTQTSTKPAQTSTNLQLAEVRQAIDEGNAKWIAAWAQGDAASIAATFTADGRMLTTQGEVLKGREQILSHVKASMQKVGGTAKLTVITTDLWLDGDTAYETGKSEYDCSRSRSCKEDETDLQAGLEGL